MSGEQGHADESARQNEEPTGWEKIRIQQLGFVNNVFLGLAVGVLVFGVNLLIDHTNRLNAAPISAGLALLLSALSAFSGLIATITRLIDFRLAAKDRRREPIAQQFGQWTWWLLRLQVITFFLSTVFAGFWFWILIACKPS